MGIGLTQDSDKDDKILIISTEPENKITNSIFDLAGHERFKPLIPKFIEGATGALLVFDSVDITTFKKLD